MAKTKSDTTKPSIISPNTVIAINIPWAEVEPVYRKSLASLAKKVKSSGFRPGKVPPHLAAELIGPEKIKEEALKQLLPARYQAALQASNKKPLTYPEFQAVKVELDQDWQVEAHIAERPSLRLDGYQKVVKSAQKIAQKELADLAKQKKQTENSTPTTPTPAKTEAQLKAEQDDQTLQIIFRELITHFKPTVPELLVKEETRGELEQIVRSLSQLNMKLDDYLNRRQINFEQLSTELASQAVARLQLEFILQTIIELTGIKAEEKDIEEYLNRIEDEKEREHQRQHQHHHDYLVSLIVRKKVTDHLLSL